MGQGKVPMEPEFVGVIAAELLFCASWCSRHRDAAAKDMRHLWGLPLLTV